MTIARAVAVILVKSNIENSCFNIWIVLLISKITHILKNVKEKKYATEHFKYKGLIYGTYLEN
jgi:hypothetical protein